MSMFTLALSFFTTSNLPCFMDLAFQVPMHYCFLQHQTLLPSPVTSTTGCWFCFGSFFILSGVISPLFSGSILGTYQPGEFIFQCHILVPFHTVHGVLKVKRLKWFAIAFSSGPYLSELSTMTSWVTLQHMAHSSIESDKVIIHLISLVSFLWLQFSFCLPFTTSCIFSTMCMYHLFKT